MSSLPNNENKLTLLLLPHAKCLNLGSLKSASTLLAAWPPVDNDPCVFLERQIQQQRQAA